MRVARWNADEYNWQIINVGTERLRKAAELLAENVRATCPVGTIKRPIYKTGPYAGAKWTARDGGSLRKSVRVVEKKRSGKQKQFRVYVGNYFAYYAAIVEFKDHFMQRAVNISKPMIENILENS